jgi:hypothetical protein
MATRAMAIEDGKTGEVSQAVYEHPFIVRLCHWVNAVSLFVMVGSGLQIFRAFPSFWGKDPPKRSTRLAQGPCTRRMAGRRPVMAPYLHVDLYCDWPGVHRVPDLQRKLQAGALRAR